MSAFKPSKRQSAILSMVARDGFVATEAMVAEFGVTPQTIRSGENLPYADRLRSGVQAKQKIAEMTASLIPDGSSLFLNTGTTTEVIAQTLLRHKNLHVVTNNINIARYLSQNETFQIMLAGGQVRNHDGGVTGAGAAEFVDSFRMDIGILGVSGVDEDGSLLEFDPAEIRSAQSVLRNSRQVILVADQHKFGRRAMNRMGDLSEVDMLVTDAPLAPAFEKACQKAGVEIFSSDTQNT